MIPRAVRRPFRAAAVLVFAGASTLGLWRLGAPSFWLDEAVSWSNASGSWQRLVNEARQANDMGGILYSLVLKAWISLAGTSEFALRLPSVVLMLAMVGVVMETARVLRGRRAAVVVGIVTTLHPSIVGAGRQARGYILLLLLASCCLLGLAWQWAGRRRASRGLMGVASLLAAATHVFGPFVAAGTALASAALAWDTQRDVPGSRPARAALVALLPFLPAVLFTAAWQVVLAPVVRSSLETFWMTGSILRGLVLPAVTLVMPVVAGAAGLLILDHRRTARRLAAGALLVSLPIVAGPIAASLLVRSDHSFAAVRYMLPLVPVGTLVCGAALSRVRWQVIVAATAALAIVTGVSAWSKHQYSTAARAGHEIRDAAAFLRQQVKPGDEVRTMPVLQSVTAAYYRVPGLHTEPDASPPTTPPPSNSVWTMFFNGRRADGPPPGPGERTYWFGTLLVVQTAGGAGIPPAR